MNNGFNNKTIIPASNNIHPTTYALPNPDTSIKYKISYNFLLTNNDSDIPTELTISPYLISHKPIFFLSSKTTSAKIKAIMIIDIKYIFCEISK